MSDVDLFPPGTFKDEEPTEEAEASGVVVEEPPEPDEGGADNEESNDQEAPIEAPLIFGKYKTIEDAEKGHKELERQFHERQQQAPPEPEAEEDSDPFGLWGTELGDGEAQQLAERLIRYPADAQQIVEYTQSNQHLFGPAGQEVSEQMFALWNAQNPYAAQSWIADQRMQAWQDQVQAQQAPIQSHYTQQMAGLAVHRATAELPRFAEFKDQIMETITSPNMQAFLAQNPEYASDPQKMFEVLQGAWTNLIAQEYRTNQQHAASASGEAPAPATPEKAKPRTQQRSTVKAPTQIDADDLFPLGTFRDG